MKTKVKTVCGLLFVSISAQLSGAGHRILSCAGGQTYVNRNQAGVHPFMRNRGPSSLRLVRITWRIDYCRVIPVFGQLRSAKPITEMEGQ